MATTPHQPNKVPRSKQRRPEPRTVVVGDLHGDFDALRGILREASLIDAREKWIGGRQRLIQLGDCIDRGPQSIEVVGLLRELQAAAPPGSVVRLAGNHEMELMRGCFRYSDLSSSKKSLLAEGS